MATLTILVGLPGCGKSTYANKCKLYDKTGKLQIVSTDEIRRLSFGDESDQTHNSDVFGIAYWRIGNYLKAGYDVIFDATNLTVADRAKVIKKFHDFPIKAVWFQTDVKTCCARQKLRARKVPSLVILRMARKMVPPTVGEGFESVEVY